MILKTVYFLSIIYVCCSLESFSLKGCTLNKACFKSSMKCEVDNCDFIATWKPMKYNGNYYVEFELIGNVKKLGGYIALSFAEKNDLKSSGFVGCYAIPSSDQVGFFAGYKKGNDDIIIPQSKLDSDFLVTKDKDNKKYGGFMNRVSERISCRFLRLTKPTKEADKVKDLSNDKDYFLNIARGPSININGLTAPFPGSSAMTSSKVGFYGGSYFVSGSSAPNSKLAKLHGILMVIAWMGCCSIAVMLSRYYKDMWPPRTYRSSKVGWTEGGWFDPHRGLQSCAFVLIVVSIIVIFVNVRGYSKLEDMPAVLHPILGLISACLFVINPFIALCRCQRLDSCRPCFNWTHFLVGTFAYVISLPTIMIGLRLPGAGITLTKLNYPQLIVICFALFQFIVEIILEIHSCTIYRSNKKNKQFYDREVEEYEQALQHKDTSILTKPKPPRTKGRGFRLFMLALFIIVAICVTVGLCVIIAIH